MSIQESNKNHSMLPSFYDFTQGAKDPIAAGAAIIPPYVFFRDKFYLQLGENIPPRQVFPLLKEGIQATPVISGIVGSQIIFQKFFNLGIEKVCGTKINESSGAKYLNDFASCGLVAAISTPGYLEFNRRAMKMPFSLNMLLSAKQAKFIAFRELCFMNSLIGSGRIAKEMKSKFGDSKIVEYTSIFFTGAVGSLAGHPADTIVTRLMNSKPVDYKWNVKSMNALMQGGLTKACGIGFFCIIYNAVKDKLSE
jgi:hypothetical protein